MTVSLDAIAERLHHVRMRIAAAADRADRAPKDIALLAVSKKQPAAAIRAAWRAGQRAFGESYVQEALDKMSELDDLPIEWHFIGRIQSNKTRQIAAHFDWAHGLADAGHAHRLNEQRPNDAPPLNVCLQIHLGDESSKAGIAPEAAAELLAACAELPNLRVRGLMALPPLAEDEAAQREPFRALRVLRDQLTTPDLPLDCLSMGMSQDLEAAILEGATIVRIGTSVFGERLL